MSVLVCTLQGRFGNQALQWLFAYAFAQKHGMEFQCDPWVGERIFLLPEYSRPWASDAFRRVNEIEIFDVWRDDRNANWNYEEEKPGPGCDLAFRGYAQCQSAMIYTKREAQSWLKLRPEILSACANIRFNHIVGHQRKGDYIGYGYPVVRLDSYYDACLSFGLDPEKVLMCDEETAEAPANLPADLSFVADFYRMMHAPTLLRGNSSFSWLAALLGNGLVLSPVVDGLEGGKEHHCKFVAGNHPRFANLDFVSDLYVSP